jgi:hypothetical protein
LRAREIERGLARWREVDVVPAARRFVASARRICGSSSTSEDAVILPPSERNDQ